MEFFCHLLEYSDVAYRLPVGSEVHAAVSPECGSPEVQSVGWCVTVKVSSEVPHSESHLIAVDNVAVLVLLLVEGLEPRP